MEAEKGKGTEKTEAWHKPKNGSVFPAERRTVKRMMYEKVKQLVKPKGSNTVWPAPETSK